MDSVVRYGAATRLVHWVIALLFVLLFLGGLALFHPAFFWLAALFGGGTWLRILHPFFGAALLVLFLGYGAGIWRENLLLPSDRTWLKNAVAVMTKRKEIPVQGKYNAGQKVMFWWMLLSIVGLAASGVVLWRPYFADAFGADLRALATAVHVFFAFFMFAAIGVHVYAAFFTKGSITAMLRGTVTRRWARFHHPGWYREVAAHEGAAHHERESKGA
jgi:formate dehydrogenase subunit gamma